MTSKVERLSELELNMFLVPGRLYTLNRDWCCLAGPTKPGMRNRTPMVNFTRKSVFMYIGNDYDLFDRLQQHDSASDRSAYVGFLKEKYRVFLSCEDGKIYYMDNVTASDDLREARTK